MKLASGSTLSTGIAVGGAGANDMLVPVFVRGGLVEGELAGTSGWLTGEVATGEAARGWWWKNMAPCTSVGTDTGAAAGAGAGTVVPYGPADAGTGTGTVAYRAGIRAGMAPVAGSGAATG